VPGIGDRQDLPGPAAVRERQWPGWCSEGR